MGEALIQRGSTRRSAGEMETAFGIKWRYQVCCPKPRLAAALKLVLTACISKQSASMAAVSVTWALCAHALLVRSELVLVYGQLTAL